jgi:outer membrane protein assembly factor BamB
MFKQVCCLVAFFLLVPSAIASDWPQLRGPTGQGISSQRGLPLTWSADKNVVWKVNLPGAGWSSPIVIGERIFLTSYTGFMVPGKPVGNMDDLKRQISCLDRKTGNLLWTTDVPSKLPEQARIREGHGFASSTPVADQERVYAFFGKSGVFAFNHDGKQIWNANVGTKLDGFGSAAPPTLHGDLLLVNASIESQSVVALDKKTGKEVWRAGGIRESWHAPLVVEVGGKTEIVVAITGKVLGLDPKSGEQLWSSRTDIGWYMVPSLLAHDGVVYYLGGRAGVVAGAIRAGGSGDVTRSHRLWTSTKGSNVTSPILRDGYLYWMSDQLGIAYCAEAKSGRIVYEERIPGARQVYASPVLSEGRIYYTDRAGTTFVVAAQPQFKLLATNTLERRIFVNASPAITGDRFLMRADQVLYCIGENR